MHCTSLRIRGNSLKSLSVSACVSPMTSPLNVLIVGNSADGAALLVDELRGCGFDPRWQRVETEADYLEKLKAPVDLVLSDYSMPRFSGLRAVHLLRESGLNVPLIIVSSARGSDASGEERAVECLKAGATDYLLKDGLRRLGLAVERALREVPGRTERKKNEVQFIEAQKMEVLGHLAGGVAHDFNNILAVIIGYGEMMIASVAPDDPKHEYATEILQATERASALTRQLLLFTRKEAVQPTILDLGRVVEDTNKMLRRLINENVALTILSGEKLGHIKADAGYVGQVLINLAVNARDAMQNGGQLTIETKNVTLDNNYAAKHAGATPGDYVLLEVSDTGTGITEDVKRRMFEPFFTTKPKGTGTGLGLMTCQTIAKQCGGHIEVSSELGKGTTFSVYFPRVEQPLDKNTEVPKDKPLRRGTETLLLVEDEPSVRHLACSVLEAQGYTVLRANNGQDGLDVVLEHKGSPISLVVTDVVMPQMSGKMMAEWLKATYPELRVLFTSGYTDDTATLQGVLEPGVAFLPKPYSPATLTHEVRELLDNSQTATRSTPPFLNQ